MMVYVKLQRSEALGLCLAAFSATLPYLGRFLEVGNEMVPLWCLMKWCIVLVLDVEKGKMSDW